jgi:hypothetical protein
MVFLGLIAVLRALAVFTENVNWDEFALFQRAEILAQTGVLQGGGRPGLVVLLLAPLAEVCSHAIDSLVQARHAWTAMTLASALALWHLLFRVLPTGPFRWIAATTGLALWGLSPTVLRYSVQVRTDMPAIFLGLVGSLALLESRRYRALALLGGALLGTGFLFTQKLVYVAALGGTLVAGWHLLHAEFRLKREASRVALAGVGFLGVLGAYRVLVAAGGTSAPPLLPMEGAMSTFAYYREFVGWTHYGRLLPLHLPQLVVVLLLVVLAVAAVRRPGALRRHAGLALGVLVVGTGVLLFHAGRFPYFYPVLGLFPAAIGALVLGPLLTMVPKRSARYAAVGTLWIPLVAGAAGMITGMLVHDDQAHQRRSLDFVAANFPAEARGFNARAAFVCRGDPEPFRVFFGEHLRRVFGGPNADTEIAGMLQAFRERPVRFMIEPEFWEAYPSELRDFWGTRYVRYFENVSIPGRDVRGPPGSRITFEVIVPGTYRWWPAEGQHGPLVVSGNALRAGDEVVISFPGEVELELPEGGVGVLAFAVDDAPEAVSHPFFRRF